VELRGLIGGLLALKYPCRVEIKTANKYISDCGERLLHGKGNDRFAARVHQQTEEDCDLWQQIKDLSKVHLIRITWGTASSLRCEKEWGQHQALLGPKLGNYITDPRYAISPPFLSVGTDDAGAWDDSMEPAPF
jgi:hypothetical protein